MTPHSPSWVSDVLRVNRHRWRCARCRRATAGLLRTISISASAGSGWTFERTYRRFHALHLAAERDGWRAAL